MHDYDIRNKFYSKPNFYFVYIERYNILYWFLRYYVILKIGSRTIKIRDTGTLISNQYNWSSFFWGGYPNYRVTKQNSKLGIVIVLQIGTS